MFKKYVIQTSCVKGFTTMPMLGKEENCGLAPSKMLLQNTFWRYEKAKIFPVTGACPGCFAILPSLQWTKSATECQSGPFEAGHTLIGPHGHCHVGYGFIVASSEMIR